MSHGLATDLPPPPADEKQLEKVKALLESLRNPIPTRRINSRNHAMEKQVFLTPDGAGLIYSPTSKGKNHRALLFTDLCEVTQVDRTSNMYHKAKLHGGGEVVLKLNCRNHKGWRLVLESQEVADLWMAMIGYKLFGSKVEGVEEKPATTEETQEGRIVSMWQRADVNHDGKLSFSEIQRLMVRMNVEISTGALKALFREHDASGDGTLDMEEFTSLYLHLTKREELRPLFKTYAAAENEMTFEEFQNFRRDQGEKEDADADKEEFAILAPNSQGRVEFTDFVNYILSPKCNNALDPQHVEGVVDDMTQPLKDYFINSSHNTYLSGDQFRSSSDVDMYKRALLAGCRCVELDCWDGANNDPVIYHGYTRTSKIRFADVVETIKIHAFKVSDMPVILSLEVHTSPAQCKVMAEYLDKTFGDMMPRARDLENLTYTPEGLKNKILVKWKLPYKDVDDVEEFSATGEVEEEMAPEEEKEELSKRQSESSANNDMTRQLSECVTVGAFKTTNHGEDAEPYCIQSYSETKVNSLAHSNPAGFIAQTSRMMVRTYPKGTRVGSSNYNPSVAWAMGAQVVALNYQTWDDDLSLYDGMFSLNRAQGYVLKPDFLRHPEGGAKPTPCKLTVTVMCGARIPKPSLEYKGDIVDPYVKVSINQHSATEGKTTVVKNNGLTPSWMQTFTLYSAQKEVDVLFVKVMDQDSTSANDGVCSMAIPLRALRNGYRAVPMRLCKSGVILPGTAVLCQFVIEDGVSQ